MLRHILQILQTSFTRNGETINNTTTTNIQQQPNQIQTINSRNQFTSNNIQPISITATPLDLPSNSLNSTSISQLSSNQTITNSSSTSAVPATISTSSVSLSSVSPTPVSSSTSSRRQSLISSSNNVTKSSSSVADAVRSIHSSNFSSPTTTASTTPQSKSLFKQSSRGESAAKTAISAVETVGSVALIAGFGFLAYRFMKRSPSVGSTAYQYQQTQQHFRAKMEEAAREHYDFNEFHNARLSAAEREWMQQFGERQRKTQDEYLRRASTTKARYHPWLEPEMSEEDEQTNSQQAYGGYDRSDWRTQSSMDTNLQRRLQQARTSLGLSSTAPLTVADIKNAFKLKAMETHPDIEGT